MPSATGCLSESLLTVYPLSYIKMAQLSMQPDAHFSSLSGTNAQ